MKLNFRKKGPITNQPGGDSIRKIICENDAETISCPNAKVLIIQSGYYGRRIQGGK